MDILGNPIDPLEILRDYGLPLLTLVISIIAVIIQRNTKAFTYTRLSTTQLFQIHDEVKDKLKIFYEERPIEKLHLLVIRFQNSGNIPIKPEDFISDIVVELNDEAQILSNEVIETNPEVFNYTIKGEENKLIIYPTLFNNSDSITIKMLISKYEEIKQIYGRIVGVSSISEIHYEPRQDRITRLLALFLLVMALIIYYTVPLEIRNNIVIFLVMALYFLFGFFGIFFPRLFRQFARLVNNITSSQRTARAQNFSFVLKVRNERL